MSFSKKKDRHSPTVVGNEKPKMIKKSRLDQATASGLRPSVRPASEFSQKRVVLLPVEPHRLHAYWEFPFRRDPVADPMAPHRRQTRDEARQTKMILRFHALDAAQNPTNHFDLEIEAATGSCYVEVPTPGGSYYAELGFRAALGRFFPAVRSAVVATPAPAPAPPEPQAAASLVPQSDPTTRDSHPPLATPEPPAPPPVTEALTPAAPPADRSTPGAAVPEENHPAASPALLAVSASPNVMAIGKASKSWRADQAPVPGSTAPGQPIAKELAPWHLARLDLTEFCEQRFAPGNSSPTVPSPAPELIDG